MPGMRLTTIETDGTTSLEPVDVELYDPITNGRVLDEHGQPCVVVKAMPVGRHEHLAILRSYERIVDGKPVVDEEAATNDLLRRKIVSWKGLLSRSGQPLPCTDTIKVLLPDTIKTRVMAAILGTEVVSSEASFRELAALAGVVQ
jgi:hypothetical protein